MVAPQHKVNETDISVMQELRFWYVLKLNQIGFTMYPVHQRDMTMTLRLIFLTQELRHATCKLILG